MNEERVREGIEHLQGAALELIAAARAFLDVAEDVVRDPAALVEVVSEVARSGPPSEDGRREPRVQHIRVG